VKLKKLNFVDTKRYKSGVEMDVKSQLLTVALKPGQKPDNNLIAKSIWNAGYVPVERYSMEKGKIKAHTYPKFEK
jgi:hypothetical protein